MMDSLPPNDPNRNNNNNHNGRSPGGAAKEQPYDGSKNRNSNNGVDHNAPMNIMGDLEEAPAVVMMFLVGVAAWLLREQCVC